MHWTVRHFTDNKNFTRFKACVNNNHIRYLCAQSKGIPKKLCLETNAHTFQATSDVKHDLYIVPPTLPPTKRRSLMYKLFSTPKVTWNVDVMVSCTTLLGQGQGGAPMLESLKNNLTWKKSTLMKDLKENPSPEKEHFPTKGQPGAPFPWVFLISLLIYVSVVKCQPLKSWIGMLKFSQTSKR